MNDESLYYKTIRKELTAWEKRMTKRPRLSARASKAVQTKLHSIMPKKVQGLIAASIKTLIDSIVSGSSFFTKTETSSNTTLAESDFLVERAYATYHKAAVAQGIGFGLGGFLINLADLPALLSIKSKFLFDCAKLYGFDVNEKSERLFMMYVFQLAFCSDSQRLIIFPIIKNWNDFSESIEVDWEKLQMEYRDYLDIAKLLQILPVVGSIAGGAANHNLIQKLKITAMNSYRLRIIRQMEINDIS